MIFTDYPAGPIKPLHGVNCAPYLKASGRRQELIERLFYDAKPPYCRLHDCCGNYGGSYFVDVPNIFRDFSADENDPASYDFYYTDEYIAALVKNGAQIVYRLGSSIEWGTKQYATNPPEDFGKWARVCEHIILHYNEGWKDGFQYGIEYWEIWNEPENPPMWTGSKEQFFALYATASRYLKEKFPALKIGGYGSCGFYSLTRPKPSDFQRSFVPYFTDFLAMCKREGCPLDFFSWHLYTQDAAEIAANARYVRKTLNAHGFQATESHLNEWNYADVNVGGFDKIATLTGAAFCASALITMQQEPVDLANYYDLNPASRYNGWIDLRTRQITPVAYVFQAFAELFERRVQTRIRSERNEPAAIAAMTEGNLVALISNYGGKNVDVPLMIDTARPCRIISLLELTERGFVPAGFASRIPMAKDSVYLMRVVF